MDPGGREAVDAQRAADGYNETVQAEANPVGLFLRKFTGLTAYMLEVTIVVACLPWVRKYTVAYIIGVLLVTNAVLGDLVRGDVVRVRLGDVVPADLVIVQGQLSADQSALTGESQPMAKAANDEVLSGSTVVRGEATCQVVRVGAGTVFGRTVSLVQTSAPKTHTDHVIGLVTRALLAMVVVCVAVAFVVTAARGDDTVAVIPLMLLLLTSGIPIALPAMFTVTMALGSVELARRGVLVTRLNATEDAASMTVLCSDKTGTITENRLTIVDVHAPDGDDDAVLTTGYLASSAANHDPIDSAFCDQAERRGLVQRALARYRQTDFTPFDPSTRRTEGHVVDADTGAAFSAVKGAVASVVPLCQDADAVAASISAVTAAAVSIGDRVISLDAYRRRKGGGGGGGDLEIVGVDWSSVDGFGDVYPEDKHGVIRALQQAGHVVGMTGDGVNDAPALKLAEVGIAMSNATDIAKGAASAVLTHEGLAGALALVEVGRETHQRIVTWMLNKIIKTCQQVVYVVLAYLVTPEHYVVIDAVDIVVLLFLVDFVTIAISTDRVTGSPRPTTFDVGRLALASTILGMVCVGESIGLLYIGAGPLDLAGDTGQLHTFNFVLLYFFGFFTLFSVRNRACSYGPNATRPGWVLLGVSLTVAALVLIIATLGIIIPSLPLWKSAVVVAYSFACAFLVNDLVKVATLRWLKL
ncbi:hypothetical protein PBRA_006692 [Plasmodiophora brassicae]|uniref:P-type ATPase A domain-containing protein n=1 Tax=Plasmodiophora brassicae TaxID=37360 RepID=A0A0G4ITA4_PLABS|nr:hypothetical protein PBRA_006692 [Plasmodiophora brassicae]